MSRPIRLFWWRESFPDWTNFGDEITVPLLERITGRKVVWSTRTSCDAVGAGSVLHGIANRRAHNMPFVWGTGFVMPRQPGYPLLQSAPQAVRGRLTMREIEADPDGVRYGDPGLLANVLLDDQTPAKTHALGVIPHYRHFAHPFFEVLFERNDRRVKRIDVRWSPEAVAEEIAACDAVVSSSLHGLIVSDSLGVPNLRIRSSKELIGGDFKFEDYNSAFDREQIATLDAETSVGISVDDLLDRIRTEYRPPIGIEAARQGLLDLAQSLV